MKEFIRLMAKAFPELLPLAFYNEGNKEERRGCLACLLVIISLVAFCSIVGIVLWLVFR